MAFLAPFSDLSHRLQSFLLRRYRTQLKLLSRLQHACLVHSLPDLPPAARPPVTGSGKTAIVVHIHYADLWPEISARLQALTLPFDLIVTVTGDEVLAVIGDDVTRHFPSATLLVVENRGRDVRPFVQLLAEGRLAAYDIVCKLHAKKSPHRRDGTRWRDGALDSLVGSADQAAHCLAAFAQDPTLGLLGPSAYLYRQGPHFSTNGPWLARLAARLGLGRTAARADFVAGTMFWVRVAALVPLAAAGDLLTLFEGESGQIDGTLAHALERAMPMLVRQGGWHVASI